MTRGRCCLRDVGEHPRSYGFPPEHPEMHSFLGVPIVVRGVPWGRLYLTEKQDAREFTEADEQAAVILAGGRERRSITRGCMSAASAAANSSSARCARWRRRGISRWRSGG